MEASELNNDVVIDRGRMKRKDSLAWDKDKDKQELF